jgi:hypothetical protein
VTRRLAGAPLALAGLLAVPTFFASLIAVSLAIESPVRVQWRSATGRLIERDHPPTSSAEATIWALALVAPALLLAVGAAASLWRRAGIYPVSAAAVVLALLLTHRLDRWVAHHSTRFRFGVDLVPDTDPSNTLSRGEWESSARETVLSLTHWTIGLALAAILVAAAALALRRRRGGLPLPSLAAGSVGRRSTWRRWVGTR